MPNCKFDDTTLCDARHITELETLAQIARAFSRKAQQEELVFEIIDMLEHSHDVQRLPFMLLTIDNREPRVEAVKGQTAHGHDQPPTLQTSVAIASTGNIRYGLKSGVASLERDLTVDVLKQRSNTISSAAREPGITDHMDHYAIKNLDIDYETRLKKMPTKKLNADNDI